MNEDFNNINWDEINEPDIPEDMLFAIRNLASDDKDIRSESLWDLFDCIYYSRYKVLPSNAFQEALPRSVF